MNVDGIICNINKNADKTQSSEILVGIIIILREVYSGRILGIFEVQFLTGEKLSSQNFTG